MKLSSFTIPLAIVIVSQVAAQKIKQAKPLISKEPLGCTYAPQYSVSERSRFYPFNITDAIKLVSFRYHRNNYPIKVNSVLVDSLIESKTLTKGETNSLTDILYNNFYHQRPGYGMLGECFLPRNAILFYDRVGRLKEYIIICFHCGNYERSSNKVRFGDNCTEKVEKLRQFYIAKGVKFGTDRSVSLYPGEESGAEFVLPKSD
jgi:hypothetical protein